MFNVRDIIISLLEEEEYELSLRPINMTFSNGIILALIIPREKSELVLEFKNPEGSIIEIGYFNKLNSGRVCVPGDAKTKFNLAHPDEYEDLRLYLKEKCYNRHVEVEFEDILDHDFATAWIVGARGRFAP